VITVSQNALVDDTYAFILYVARKSDHSIVTELVVNVQVENSEFSYSALGNLNVPGAFAYSTEQQPTNFVFEFLGEE
jgi:hypothetical protein